MLRSVDEISTDTLVMELQRRGFDASAIINQMQRTDQPKVKSSAKVISIATLRQNATKTRLSASR